MKYVELKVCVGAIPYTSYKVPNDIIIIRKLAIQDSPKDGKTYIKSDGRRPDKVCQGDGSEIRLS